MSKDRCPYISRKCADCLDECTVTGHICELEISLMDKYTECKTWKDLEDEDKA